MHVVLHVFERKDPSAGTLTWATLGLGKLDQVLSLRSPTKLRARIVEGLKRAVGEATRHELRLLSAPRPRLERVRLELVLRAERTRKQTGVFPLIFDRRRTADGEVTLAYHPLRPKEVLTLDPEQAREGQLTRFFSRTLATLSDEAIAALAAKKGDVLKTLAITVSPGSLLDELESRRSLWSDLEVDPERDRKGKNRKKKKPKLRGGPPPLLQRLGSDLTARAASDTLDTGVPREPIRTQLAQLVAPSGEAGHARGARSVVVLGETGVGKRTALRQLVADLLEADGFTAHRNLDRVTHVWQLAASHLIAGMSYLGEWEKRIVDLVEQVRARRVILLFEDLHTLGRVGRSRSSERCMADVLRGPVQRGEVVLLGSCTPSQWHRLEEDAPAFASSFTPLHLEPASRRETLAMLLGEARKLERRENCILSPALLRGTIEEGAVLADQSLPGRALDLLRSLALGRGPGTVPFDDLIGALATRTGLPATVLEIDDGCSRDEILEEVGEMVIGQPVAVGAAVDLVQRIQGGLTDPKRPFGAYLFTGPTGTGKTQLAKAIADALFGEERMVRFDMGEFSDPGAVARLMGDRFEPRGRLTEAIRQQPFSVLLLDEIEKAHPSVLYLLLQLLDDGRLTDATGERVDFTRCVVILTSNLGAKVRASLGFADGGEGAEAREAERTALDVAKAVKEFFPPELFNRIERVVPFAPLSRETARAIADRELAALLARRGLQERNVFVIPHRSAIEHMADAAFDPRAGARSVKRYLETHVASLLAEHLASQARPEMELIRLFHEGGRYQMHSSALTEADAREGDSPLRDLLNAKRDELVARLPDALERVDALAGDDALTALSEQLRQHLAHLTEPGDDDAREHADAVYFIDQLRSELAEFREHLETWAEADAVAAETEQMLDTEQYTRTVEPDARQDRRVRLLHRRWMRAPMPRQDRREMLAAFAELAMIERAVHAETRTHRVRVELVRVGRAFGTMRRLMGDLVDLYTNLRGERTAVACLTGGGIHDTLHAPQADVVVLELAGLNLHTALASEEGCHLRISPDGESEVVRVRVLPADDERTPREAIERILEDRRRYADALERGVAPDLEDPERLLPVVRRITGERPGRQPALCQVEDYLAAHAESGRVRNLQDLLLPMLWLHATWEAS